MRWWATRLTKQRRLKWRLYVPTLIRILFVSSNQLYVRLKANFALHDVDYFARKFAIRSSWRVISAVSFILGILDVGQGG